MKESDLRNSRTLQIKRTKADDEGVSGDVWVFNSEESIFKASSTRNLAVVSIFMRCTYYLRLQKNHQRVENQDSPSTAEVQVGFERIARGTCLRLEAHPEGFVLVQRPQPRPTAGPIAPLERDPRLVHLKFSGLGD